jgi:hypothetical protein
MEFTKSTGQFDILYLPLMKKCRNTFAKKTLLHFLKNIEWDNLIECGCGSVSITFYSSPHA